MPTIATLWAVVVIGSVPFVLLFVIVLAYFASRNEQDLQVDLRARLFRLTFSITPTRCRDKAGLSAPDQRHSPSEHGEKAS